MKRTRRLRWVFVIGVGVLVLGGGCLVTGCKKDDSVATTSIVATSDPNGEGVRPDVRQYIEATYPASAKTRAALFQYAKVMDKVLADANDKQLSIQHGEESSRASECLTYILGDDSAAVDRSHAIKKNLRAVILNTNERNRAYFAYDENLGDQYFPSTPHSQIASTCDINPSTLSN